MTKMEDYKEWLTMKLQQTRDPNGAAYGRYATGYAVLKQFLDSLCECEPDMTVKPYRCTKCNELLVVSVSRI